MAAYAALVSLMHTIEQIQHHPRPPISLDKTQVESLTKKVTFLQDFLEGYSHGGDTKEADVLESRIADASHAAEDVIESHVADRILDGSTIRQKISRTNCFPCLRKATYIGLEKVTEDLDFIKKGVMEIKEKTLIDQYHLHRNSTPADSLRSSFMEHTFMVGFDDVLNEIMDKLTGQQSNRQIIPIVGMGGIGRTALARNVFLNPFVEQHFHIRAWTIVSEGYSTSEILREVLYQVNKQGSGDLSGKSENELGETLYKCLSGWRYLIIMDDMWNTEAWDKIKFFFPDCNNGSRIVLTTRLSNLAFQLTDSYWLHMKFLDMDESWNLFCKTVFGEEGCPLELEEVGKKIVKGCRGLPLSIAVIGGLLAKSEHKQEYWEYIAENINSIVNLEDNERCLKILYMSYNQLPVYLKPCFLYMGVFPEDNVIRVSVLIKLWVAEGFLKPIRGKSMEVVAKEYFKDLIGRNLILIHKLGSTGNIKYCKIHDLLRDLCLREAQKERFYNVVRQNSLDVQQDINVHRRIVLPEWLSPKKKFRDALRSTRLARSLICYSRKSPPSLDFHLLRIWNTFDEYARGDSYFLENMFHLVNLRFIAFTAQPNSKFCSSIYRLWNLRTLIVDHRWDFMAPFEIWKMSQLRHVKFFKLHLPDPPNGDHMDGNNIVLENLQMLSRIKNFKFSEEIIKRIPNIKKLGVVYDNFEGSSHYFLYNLERLDKLESFGCSLFPSGPGLLNNLTFPYSLKKLTIRYFHSEDILEKIGLLPLLEKLKLIHGIFKGRKWETVEGQFCNLKYLQIQGSNLRYWKTESTHFPRLEHFVLHENTKLKRIPLDIGQISTLQSIHLEFCRDSVISSAKKILEEQEELGNVGLQVQVVLREKNYALKSFTINSRFSSSK